MTFFQQLHARSKEIDSLLCVGLDPHLSDLESPTAGAALAYCRALVDATKDLAAAFKPNAAFFEALGPDGLKALGTLIGEIGPDVPVILDVKRGDIASTAAAYAHSAFEVLGAGAVTLSPWMGKDAIEPFLAFPNTGVFVLCRTSNPGAEEIQGAALLGRGPLFMHLAKAARRWAGEARLGLVVGATQPAALAKVRRVDPQGWILAPGVGAQGGDLDEALDAGLRADGSGLLIAISRGIARAPHPRRAAVWFRDEIRRGCREFRPQGKPADTRQRAIDPELGPLADALLSSGCVRFGVFTLKSGLTSPIYIDLRRLVATPTLMAQVAQAYLPILQSLSFDHIAALPYAALPIGTAISLLGGYSMVYPRKETKGYGTKATVEGVFGEGEEVVIIDDLATTGSSKFEALAQLTEVGLKAAYVVVLVDRESGATEALTRQGLTMRSIFRLTDLLERWAERGLISEEQYEATHAFLNGEGRPQ